MEGRKAICPICFKVVRYDLELGGWKHCGKGWGYRFDMEHELATRLKAAWDRFHDYLPGGRRPAFPAVSFHYQLDVFNYQAEAECEGC